MNKEGNPDSLIKSQPGNRNAQKSSVFSARTRAEEALALASRLTQDTAGFLEADRVARFAYRRSLVDLLRVDIETRGVSDRYGRPRRQVSMLTSALKECDKAAAELEAALNATDAEEEPRHTGLMWTQAEGVLILRQIATNPTAPANARVRAIEYLDAHSTKVVDREFYADLEQLSDEDIDRELKALAVPVTTRSATEVPDEEDSGVPDHEHT